MNLLQKKKAIAWGLHRVGGIKLHPNNGLLYAAEPENGTIMAIDPKKPRNYRFQPSVVRGLESPTCIRFSADGNTMYVCMQSGRRSHLGNY